MKKHLAAFLSMIGLAGIAAPAQGQVLKGADAESKTKNESKIKLTKQSAEKNASNAQIQDKRKDKWAKADAEQKAVKNDSQHKDLKNDASIKGEKSNGAMKANKSDAEIKANKNQATIKLTNKNTKVQSTQQK